MAYNFLIAPDFSPDRFGGWHLLNTLLQKRANLAMHLFMPASHQEQQQKIDEGNVSLIYANPFDAAKLIRELGYRAIVRPIGKNDEMVIASSAKGEISALEDLKSGATIAMTDNRDIKLIGLRLLEVADLTEQDLKFDIVETYQAAARTLVQGKADAAFFIKEMFDSLSNLTKTQLNVLIESNIATLSHVILVKDDFAEKDALTNVLLSLNQDADGQAVLKDLGLDAGFVAMSEEESEFMIDLMETLLD